MLFNKIKRNLRLHTGFTQTYALNVIKESFQNFKIVQDKKINIIHTNVDQACLNID